MRIYRFILFDKNSKFRYNFEVKARSKLTALLLALREVLNYLNVGLIKVSEVEANEHLGE